MCLTPIRIRNPNRGLARVGLGFLKDTTSAFIEIPCGSCPQCVRLRQSYAVQRAQMMSFAYDFYFCTLTYNNDMLPVVNINGYMHNYVNIKHVQNMMKRLRRHDAFGADFKYFAVTEYGGKRHRAHVHVMFCVRKPDVKLSRAEMYDRERMMAKAVLDNWSVNVSDDRWNPVYKPLCTYVRRRRKNGKLSTTFDFHWVDPSLIKADGTLSTEADVAFYVTKYMMKASDYVTRLKRALLLNLPPDKFEEAWSLLRPRALVSKGWGDPNNPAVRAHIRSGIEIGKSDKEHHYPLFVNTTDGSTFPLSPYYRRKMLTVNDAFDYFFEEKNDAGTGDAFRLPDDPINLPDPVQNYERQVNKFNQIQFKINQIYETENNFDDLGDGDDCHFKPRECLEFINSARNIDSLFDCAPLDLASPVSDQPSADFFFDESEWSGNEFDASAERP